MIVPLWFSMEHFWIAIVPFWPSTEDITDTKASSIHGCLSTYVFKQTVMKPTKITFSSFCSVANNMSQYKSLYTSWRCQWNAFQFHQVHLNKNAKCALFPFSTTCFQNSFKAFPNIHGILWKAYWRTHIVSWEPEGHYQYWKMFHWEPEGRCRCTKSMAIVPFWLSTDHMQLWQNIIQSNLGYPATSGPAPIRISDLAGYGRYAEIQQVQ